MNEIHKIRVLTVDDHPLMMAGIAGEIDSQAGMRVVAQACDGGTDPDTCKAIFGDRHAPDALRTEAFDELPAAVN